MAPRSAGWMVRGMITNASPAPAAAFVGRRRRRRHRRTVDAAICVKVGVAPAAGEVGGRVVCPQVLVASNHDEAVNVILLRGALWAIVRIF